MLLVFVMTAKKKKLFNFRSDILLHNVILFNTNTMVLHNTTVSSSIIFLAYRFSVWFIIKDSCQSDDSFPAFFPFHGARRARYVHK